MFAYGRCICATSDAVGGGQVAVREFSDDAGVCWTVWCVTPDRIHPQTRAEDYLVDCFQLGWMVFESANALEKRRLCPYPRRWDECTVGELRSLLGRAEVVSTSRPASDRVVTSVPADDRIPALDQAPAVRVEARTFRYPDGRFWTAGILFHPDDGGRPRLRFSSGMRSIDLADWPRDWASRTDDALAALLRVAAPRITGIREVANAHRRRWDDRD